MYTQDIQDKYKIPSGSRPGLAQARPKPGAAQGPARDRAAAGLGRAEPAAALYFIFLLYILLISDIFGLYVFVHV